MNALAVRYPNADFSLAFLAACDKCMPEVAMRLMKLAEKSPDVHTYVLGLCALFNPDPDQLAAYAASLAGNDRQLAEMLRRLVRRTDDVTPYLQAVWDQVSGKTNLWPIIVYTAAPAGNTNVLAFLLDQPEARSVRLPPGASVEAITMVTRIPEQAPAHLYAGAIATEAPTVRWLQRQYGSDIALSPEDFFYGTPRGVARLLELAAPLLPAITFFLPVIVRLAEAGRYDIAEVVARSALPHRPEIRHVCALVLPLAELEPHMPAAREPWPDHLDLSLARSFAHLQMIVVHYDLGERVPQLLAYPHCTPAEYEYLVGLVPASESDAVQAVTSLCKAARFDLATILVRHSSVRLCADLNEAVALAASTDQKQFLAALCR